MALSISCPVLTFQFIFMLVKQQTVREERVRRSLSLSSSPFRLLSGLRLIILLVDPLAV